MVERMIAWAGRYPIVSIEDPAGQDEFTTLAKINAQIGHRVQIIGDDVLVTNAERVARASEAAACNAVLIKVNQAGTVTEAKAGRVISLPAAKTA
jgi:enolase